MKKIVVLGSGSGGELFADQLETELPVVEVLRVMMWPDNIIQPDLDQKLGEIAIGSQTQVAKLSIKDLRRSAEKALRPYVDKVDLIVIADYLLTTTSLGYFRRRHKRQKFTGLTLYSNRVLAGKPMLILTTRPTTKTLPFLIFARRTGARTICLDGWPALIDHGKLVSENFVKAFRSFASDELHELKIRNFSPEQIFLACSHLVQFTPEFHQIFGHNTRVINTFDDTIREIYKILGLRGKPKRK